LTELIKEKEGRISKEEADRWKADGYNVVYSEKDNKTYIWESAKNEAKNRKI